MLLLNHILKFKKILLFFCAKNLSKITISDESLIFLDLVNTFFWENDQSVQKCLPLVIVFRFIGYCSITTRNNLLVYMNNSVKFLIFILSSTCIPQKWCVLFEFWTEHQNFVVDPSFWPNWTLKSCSVFPQLSKGVNYIDIWTILHLKW